jgi:hypothetical protein
VERKPELVFPTGNDATDNSQPKQNQLLKIMGLYTLKHKKLPKLFSPKISDMDVADSVLVFWQKIQAGVWILPLWKLQQ